MATMDRAPVRGRLVGSGRPRGHRRTRMSRRKRIVLAIGAVAVVVIAFVLVRVRPWSGESRPELDGSHPGVVAIEEFAGAWAEGALDDVTFSPGDENAAGAELIVTNGLEVDAPGP